MEMTEANGKRLKALDFLIPKGCSADYRSYVFQYAILRHAVNAAPFNDTDLRLIHPPMFKRFFLHQEGLTIARVVQSKFLLPLISSTPAGQIYRKGQKLNGLGFCPLRDATQCYVGELVLLFLVGLYASAECCCAICWHIFTIRQTATDITQGQACGGDAV